VISGVRPFTFFEKGVVGHVGFADPFDEKIAKVPTSTSTIRSYGGLIPMSRLSESAATLLQEKE
jgi:hypothetical protein